MQRYEALRRLAALLRAMAWIALVIGMLLVLALTFQSSDESSFFVQEITPGERVLRFVVGTLSVAYFAIPLMALGYMIPPILDIREELETKLDTHYRYLHGLWAKSQGDVPSG